MASENILMYCVREKGGDRGARGPRDFPGALACPAALPTDTCPTGGTRAPPGQDRRSCGGAWLKAAGPGNCHRACPVGGSVGCLWTPLQQSPPGPAPALPGSLTPQPAVALLCRLYFTPSGTPRPTRAPLPFHCRLPCPPRWLLRWALQRQNRGVWWLPHPGSQGGRRIQVACPSHYK